MKIEYSLQTVFSFEGPNLCFLGNESDFKLLASSVVKLTDPFQDNQINLFDLDFPKPYEINKEILFSSKKNSNSLAIIENEKIVFELDSRYWERLFKYFVLMSWDKRTYYLNSYENYLSEFELEQDCYFVCSSEF